MTLNAIKKPKGLALLFAVVVLIFLYVSHKRKQAADIAAAAQATQDATQTAAADPTQNAVGDLYSPYGNAPFSPAGASTPYAGSSAGAFGQSPPAAGTTAPVPTATATTPPNVGTGGTGSGGGAATPPILTSDPYPVSAPPASLAAVGLIGPAAETGDLYGTYSAGQTMELVNGAWLFNPNSLGARNMFGSPEAAAKATGVSLADWQGNGYIGSRLTPGSVSSQTGMVYGGKPK